MRDFEAHERIRPGFGGGKVEGVEVAGVENLGPEELPGAQLVKHHHAVEIRDVRGGFPVRVGDRRKRAARRQVNR